MGEAATDALLAAGHEVVATDIIYRRQPPCRFVLADLCDDRAVYGVLEGCEAVLHVGNHPHSFIVKPMQKILTQNVAMNTNVFRAAEDLGIKRVVFASSIQVISGRNDGIHGEVPSVCRFPYLPWDGGLPQNPGYNFYALSKALAEQMLTEMARAVPGWCAASVRFPHLRSSRRRTAYRYVSRPLSLSERVLSEGQCYLMLDDAGSLLRQCLERIGPGHRVYFAGQTPTIEGMDLDEIARTYYPDIPKRGDWDESGGLVDLRPLRDELGWTPAHPRQHVVPG